MAFNLRKILFYFLFIVLSYSVPLFYNLGDSLAYQKFYDSLHGVSIIQSFILARHTISANEPLAVLFYWLGSNLGVPKLFFNTILNIFLFHFYFTFLNKYKVSFFNIFLLCFSWYFFILIGPAERLKLSFIFLFVFFNHSSNFLLIISFLFHFSISIFSFFYFSLNGNLFNFFRKLSLINFFVLIFSFIILVYFFVPLLLTKIPENPVFSFSLIPTLLLLLSFFYYFPKRFSVNLISFFLIIPLFFVFGPSRLNMLLYFVFLHIFIVSGKSNSFFFVAINLYNFFKGLYFIYLVLSFGTAFP